VTWRVLKIEAILAKIVVLEVFAFAKFWLQRYSLVGGQVSNFFWHTQVRFLVTLLRFRKGKEQETHKRLHLTDAIAKITEKVHMPYETLKIKQSMGARNQEGLGCSPDPGPSWPLVFNLRQKKTRFVHPPTQWKPRGGRWSSVWWTIFWLSTIL
jgi:hypothetical protein